MLKHTLIFLETVIYHSSQSSPLRPRSHQDRLITMMVIDRLVSSLIIFAAEVRRMHEEATQKELNGYRSDIAKFHPYAEAVEKKLLKLEVRRRSLSRTCFEAFHRAFCQTSQKSRRNNATKSLKRTHSSAKLSVWKICCRLIFAFDVTRNHY